MPRSQAEGGHTGSRRRRGAAGLVAGRAAHRGFLFRLLARLALAPVGLALAFAGLAQNAAPGLQPVADYQVKAAFLYKFGGYVQWPARAFPRGDTPFVIGVLGDDDVADELTQVAAGRTIEGHAVTVRRLRAGERPGGMQMLFVGRDQADRIPSLVPAARQQGTLVVSESDGALARGSMINFVVDDHRIRFDVELRTAEAADLRISARLLAVARRVLQEGAQ